MTVIRLEDFQGRSIMVKMKIESQIYLIVNIYAPNQDTPVFFHKLFKRVEATGIDKKIIGGDFNLVLESLDRKGKGIHQNKRSIKAVKEGIIEADLVDIWRQKHQNESGFTWRRMRPSILCERLDFFLITSALEQMVDSVEIMPSFKSDHSQAKLIIATQFKERGKGYWKLNNSLLHNQEYVSKINNLLDIQLSQIDLYDKKLNLWEIVKMEVAGSTVQYSTRKKKSDDNKLKVLERKLKFWQQEEDLTGIFPKTTERIAELKKDIAEIYTRKAQGAIMRCKARWAELAEKPTKMFLNLEKSKYNKRVIQRIYKEDGTSDESEILQTINEFYKKLYTKSTAQMTGIEIEEYLGEISEQIPKISQEDFERLESPISLQELGKAVKQLANQKCPGVDGLPIDWYKVFWNKIKYFLHDVILEIVQQQKLHLSARRGLISLMEKLGDPLKITQWRPISLLVSDYKIFAKIIAMRMQVVLPSLIHKSQTGFMKGRQIGENILKLQSLIEYCEKEKQSGIIISVDFHKAFNSISWIAIEKALQAFGYGPNFINLVKILYNDVYFTVINNGKWKGWYRVQQGCRQGCPASALIFVQTAELLGIKIRANCNIKGLDINGEIITACQYTDDLWTALKPEEDVVEAFMDELKMFEKFSGLVINLSKTVAFKIGPIRQDAKYITKKVVVWTNEPVKILGVWIHPNQELSNSLNFDGLLKKTQKILNIGNIEI